MIWLALIVAAVIALLAYSPRSLSRLLVALSLGWVGLTYYAKGGDTDPAFVFVPLIALWIGVIAIAWIISPILSGRSR